MIFRSTILILLFFFFSSNAIAQYFQDGTANLPDGGAQFSSMDVRAADLEGDGDLDIVLANEFQRNTILINNGSGLFTFSFSHLPAVNHDSEDVAVADFDQDGDLDLIFCSEDDLTLGVTNVHEYYWNDGTAQFTAAPFQFPDSKSNAVITAEIDGDNWPDVIFGNDGQNRIFINDQSGGFIEETDSRLPAIEDLSQDLAMADVDGDGDQDLFVGNEDGNRLLLNNGSGVFSEVTLDRLPQGINMETRKVVFADVDLDGDSDVYLCNVAFIPGKDRQNRLYLNDGNGFFTDATATHLPAELKHSLDAVFVDINNDGDLDLFVCGISISNGSLAVAPIDAYFNDGSGVFTPNNQLAFGPDYLVKGLGLFAADYNGDGKTDIYVCDRKDNNPSSGGGAGANTKDVLLLAAVTSPVSNLGHLPDAINLFPNPGKQTFTLVFKNMEAVNTSFGLYDDTGKRVATPTVNQLSPNRFLLDCSTYDLSPGIYWLLIGNGGRQWYKQWQVRG